MNKEQKIKNKLETTGYIKELERHEILFYIEELQQKIDLYKSIIDELEKWLKEKLEECNTYSKYIEKKVTELQARSSGKTYIASEIMKNEVAKKNWQEVLNKVNELKDSDIK